MDNNSKSIWWLPSVETIIFMLVFYLSLFVMPYLINSDGDLGRHITIGQMLIDTRRVPAEDVFSHTMFGEKLILHEWLSDVLFSLVYRFWGMNGIAWLTSSIIAGTYALFVTGLKHLEIKMHLRFLSGTTAFLVGINHWHTRPHIITTFLFAYLILVLNLYWKTSKKQVLYSIPLVMIIWANLHGAFISALVQISIFLIASIINRKKKATKELIILLLLSFAATLLNPYGLQMLTHSFRYLQLDYLINITNEYRSPNFHDMIIWPFLATLLLTIIIKPSKSSKTDWGLLLTLLFWTASSLYSARNIPLYGLCASLYLAQTINQNEKYIQFIKQKKITDFDSVGNKANGWIWALGFAALIAITQSNGIKTDVLAQGNIFSNERFPVKAADFLLENDNMPTGNVFNDFGWGGYLLYRLWPEKLVFIDGQTDFYGENLMRIHQQTYMAENGWDKTLDAYKIDWVILPTDAPLARNLSLRMNWKKIYEDGTAIVFERIPPS